MKQFSTFRLDSVNQCLWRGEARISLRPKAFAVLCFLVQHAGRLVTQSELLEALWPDTFVQPEVLKSHILEVRAALGDNPKSPTFVETLPRRGYRFIKEVTENNGLDSVSPAVSKTFFVGRERELAQLEDYLTQACAGCKQVVFVTGETGIGKTQLVEAFMSATQRLVPGIRMAAGQCVEGCRVQEPYYPVLVAFARLLREEPELARMMEIHAPTWLVQFPGLIKPEHRQVLQGEILGATRERMLREFCDLLRLLSAEKPLLLILEDIHLADSATVDLIAAIPRHPARAKLLLIATYQPVAVVLAQHPLKTVKQSLALHGLCREVAIEPLAETEVAQYLAAESKTHNLPEGLAEVLYRHSEGNPLFLRAAIDHLIARGHLSPEEGGWKIHVPLREIEMEVPESLRQMIEIQVERLSDDERQALEVASICGVFFLTNIAATAGEFDVEAYEEICQRLARRGQILKPAGFRDLPNGDAALCHKFVHAFYRKTIYDRLPLQRRSRMHLRIGEALEALYAEALHKVASELALHFEGGCDWAKATKYLQLIALKKNLHFAYRDAASFLERALALLSKLPAAERTPIEIEVLKNLGAAYYGLDDFQRAISCLNEAAERAALSHDRRSEIVTWIQLTIVFARTSATQILEAATRLFELCNREEDSSLRTQARMSARVARTFAGAGEQQDVQQFCAELADIRSRGADRQVLAMHTTGYAFVQFFASEYMGCVRNIEASLPVLVETGDILYRAGFLGHILGLLFSGNLGNAIKVAQNAVAMTQRNSHLHGECVLRLYQAWPYLFASDWAGAFELCEAALPVLRNAKDDVFLHKGLILAGTACIGLGRYEPGTRFLAEAREGLETRPAPFAWFYRMPLQSALVELSLKQENLAMARTEVRRFLECSLATNERTWQALAWEASARVAVADSDWQCARECMRNALAVIEGFDIPLAAWRVHRLASELLPENAEEHHRRFDAGVLRLAESLQEFPSLRGSFLSSVQVSNRNS